MKAQIRVNKQLSTIQTLVWIESTFHLHLNRQEFLGRQRRNKLRTHFPYFIRLKTQQAKLNMSSVRENSFTRSQRGQRPHLLLALHPEQLAEPPLHRLLLLLQLLLQRQRARRQQRRLALQLRASAQQRGARRRGGRLGKGGAGAKRIYQNQHSQLRTTVHNPAPPPLFSPSAVPPPPACWPATPAAPPARCSTPRSTGQQNRWSGKEMC